MPHVQHERAEQALPRRLLLPERDERRDPDVSRRQRVPTRQRSAVTMRGWHIPGCVWAIFVRCVSGGVVLFARKQRLHRVSPWTLLPRGNDVRDGVPVPSWNVQQSDPTSGCG